MARDPIRTRWYLKPITQLLSLPDVIAHKTQIHRNGTDGLEPPFILLCNHNAFMDFKVATQVIFPRDCDFSVTKMALATEELYFHHRRSIGKPCRPGLA